MSSWCHVNLVMPNMNGVEVCKNIKKISPDIEVVFVSGHPSELETHIVDFISSGGREEYLRKPLIENELIDAVNKIIKEKNFDLSV